MSAKGTIVLMGSGELTATMVEVHKEMLAGIGPAARAAFVDTPAGFQLNAGEISAKAVDYFRTRVGRALSVASIRSKNDAADVNALATLRQADFILIGPGSPTYAVKQWRGTAVPEIFARRIETGGCLVAASAAALTVGRFTLPVYEIYKVGEAPHWVEGIDALSRFGLNLVVVPHWNNAEGGSHDTRFCFMGEPRFRRLEALLPPEATVCGLDEHTACIIDLAAGKARVRGIGAITLRRAGVERVFRKGESFPLAFLEGRGFENTGGSARPAGPAPAPAPESPDRGDMFWQEVHALGRRFQAGLDGRDAAAMTAAILELDGFIWQRARDLESEEAISQARESLRDWIALAGSAMSSAPPEALNCLAPVVEEMLALRRHFRSERQWREADAIRDALRRADVAVDDSPEGSRWRVLGPDEERRAQNPDGKGAAHD
jgi:cyanophycinase-like exopeptidase